MKKVLFISTGLGTGGAEKQLVRMLSHLREKIAPSVISLAGRGAVSEEIEALGIPVTHLGLENPLRLPFVAVQVFRFIRHFSPDVICGWMYHGNLAAYWVRRLAVPRARLLWGIRQSLYELNHEKPRTQRVIRYCAKVSGNADAIIYNAQIGREQHEALGFAANKGRVIDNGFDTEVFRPSIEARTAVRQELGIPADAPLIGMVARFHPMKGHEVFIEAAKLLARQHTDVHFLLAGRGLTPDAPICSAWLADAELLGRLHLLGERRDAPQITAALDISSSSSLWGEGFSNSVCEAMSCAVPVVATDVGDSRRVLGNAGFIIPAGDALALTEGWQKLLALPIEARKQMGELGRRRVMSEFSLNTVADCYLTLLEEM
jgi:glycosyltransferase involved in cell wall biosynthesis